jgi:hypothetical protein
MELPHEPHCAILCGQTGCGKTQFALDELLHPETGYFRGDFEFVFILCPTWKRNKTYLERAWLWRSTAPRFYFIEPEERLHDWLRALFSLFADSPTLYLIDDMAASKALTKKRDMLSELAFSGRHARQSVWVLTQKYNCVSKDLREQTKWVALFHCKDRDSFEDCLRENDVVPRELSSVLRSRLAETKHAKLVLKTDQPTAYYVC